MQALHALLGTPSDTTLTRVLYANRSSNDILCKEMLGSWAREYASKLELTHVLSDEPADSGWTGPRGFISRELIEKHLPGPTDDCVIFVCGPPPMYNALCGPRAEKEIKGLLAELGYSAEQVYKF
jgi:cytochrome-b5 reductase